MVALVVGALATGCGGDDDDGPSLSASAFRAKADAICRDVSTANETALKGIDRDDTSAIAKAAQIVARRTEAALDALDDLEGPDSEEAAIDRFLDRAEQFGDAAKRQSDALARNDAAAAKAAQDDADRLNAEAQQAARDAGLDACAA